MRKTRKGQERQGRCRGKAVRRETVEIQAGLRNWPVRRSLPDRLFSKSWLLPGVVLLCGQFFVTYGLGMHDGSVWSFRPVRPPEVEDDAVGLSRNFHLW